VKTDDVITGSRRTVVTSATCLPIGDRQPQRPILAGQEVDQHDRWWPEVQHE
jgi:hypothetical protein